MDLSQEYDKHYGITNKVLDFFVNYLDAESKKRLIRSILFLDKCEDKFVYKCFMSPDKCLINTSEECFKKSPVCDLNNEASMDETLIKFVRFLNNYYRNRFVHEGKESIVIGENIFFGIDYYDNQHIKILLSHKHLKEIVIKGIKNYYFKQYL